MIYPQNIELQLFLVPERQAAFNDTKSWSHQSSLLWQSVTLLVVLKIIKTMIFFQKEALSFQNSSTASAPPKSLTNVILKFVVEEIKASIQFHSLLLCGC